MQEVTEWVLHPRKSNHTQVWTSLYLCKFDQAVCAEEFIFSSPNIGGEKIESTLNSLLKIEAKSNRKEKNHKYHIINCNGVNTGASMNV